MSLALPVTLGDQVSLEAGNPEAGRIEQKRPRRGLEEAWKRSRRGLEEVEKRFGRGREEVWKRFGRGHRGGQEEAVWEYHGFLFGYKCHHYRRTGSVRDKINLLKPLKL
jgi:hypothetical protein